jgi:L-ribulose-5-phosphate 3-epimerase
MDSDNIGFMQGRLSPMLNGRIQSFPWDVWQEEFRIAGEIFLKKIEWTIDTEKFTTNPLITPDGQREINHLQTLFDFEIPSVTCDYFMENPPWKTNSNQTLSGLESILLGMSKVGASILVIPLVDNSSISDSVSHKEVKNFFDDIQYLLKRENLKIAFETDLNPAPFSDFISEFDEEYFGVNYDIGNSASLGFDPVEEFAAIGTRVINVHVKDRVLGGTTVPLLEGDADFQKVFKCLTSQKYMGNLIMQTARAIDGNHAAALSRYRSQIIGWMKEAK